MKHLIAAFILSVFSMTGNAQHLPKVTIRNVRTSVSIPFADVCKKGRVTLVCFWGTWCAHGKHQLNDIVPKERVVKH